MVRWCGPAAVRISRMERCGERLRVWACWGEKVQGSSTYQLGGPPGTI